MAENAAKLRGMGSVTSSLQDLSHALADHVAWRDGKGRRWPSRGGLVTPL
jgi:hypothetical protein